MARILVIDTEVKMIDEFKKAIFSISPDFKLLCYTSLQALHENYKSTAEADRIDFYKFDLILLDYNLLKPVDWEGQLSDLRIKTQTETVICFTTYDSANVNRKHILSLNIFNIFYKPIDTLMLKESINLSLKAKKNTKPLEMKAQSTKALVAILKEVELVSLCELGFVTMNEGSIPRESFSKYYSEIFSSGKKQSAWAQCIMSIEVPNKPGFFINKFHFVGLNIGALKNLRLFIQTNKLKKTASAVWNLSGVQSTRNLNLAVIDTKEDKTNTLKNNIEERFTNASVDYIRIDGGKITEPTEKTYDCVINLNRELKFDDYKNKFSKDTQHLLICRDVISEQDLTELQPHYQDIFCHPFDRSYFFKKLKVLMKDLKYVEVPDLLNITTSEKLKAASVVQISEICELYVNFNYYRELPNASFREFAFITDDENQMVELPGFCNYTEKSKPVPGKIDDLFFHQFIFWGMTDHYLKQIRIWLLQNHIQQNKDKNS